MAKLIPPPKGDMGMGSYEPDSGKVFSTIRLTSTTIADVLVEHDAGWTSAELVAAAKANVSTLSNRADWWSPEEETTIISTVFFQDADPDEGGEPIHCSPLELTDPAEMPDPEVVE